MFTILKSHHPRQAPVLSLQAKADRQGDQMSLLKMAQNVAQPLTLSKVYALP
jgi:hypothetical protein